jgi:hypothetical protein
MQSLRTHYFKIVGEFTRMATPIATETVYILLFQVYVKFRDILSRVWVTKDGVRIVIEFIGYLRVVNTCNYYTIVDLHNWQSLHNNLLSPSAFVLTDL